MCRKTPAKGFAARPYKKGSIRGPGLWSLKA